MNYKTIGKVLLTCLALLLTNEARSKTCFFPVFYQKMFKQAALQSEPEGNKILVAESDILTATGKNPDCKDGCMTHINNGRFDLLLRNATAEGPDLTPLSLRILQIRIGFQDLEGIASDTWVRIEKQQITNCFGTPISFKTVRSFNSATGHSASPEFLEPGEGIIGCVCLSQKDRRKTGKALIEVLYEPTVWMLDLSKNVQTERFENKILWRAQHKIRDLEQEGIRFFKFTVPNESQLPSDIRISLDDAQGLEIYNRRADHGWSQNIHDWQAGELTLSGKNAGRTFFLLVRSRRTSASGTLKTEYMTGRDRMTDSGSVMAEKDVDVFTPTAIGPPSTRIFKAYALSMGAGFGTAPAEGLPCCTGLN
jgi:hypothetical protein